MRQVPFYANHDAGLHCMLAVDRSILEYFVHQKMSWTELEAFTGFKPGKIAWSMKSLTQFANMGFDVRVVSSFDYARYSVEGEQYLYEIWPQDKLDWQIKNTNVLDILPQIPEFISKTTLENRTPQLEDIDAMLSEGRLVVVILDGSALNDVDGYDDHALLITDKTDGYYIAHDPGGKAGPPQPDRMITPDKLWQAMGGDQNTSEITGFKLKERRNLRLDQYVIGKYPLLSRAYAVRLVDDGKVQVNGKPSKAGHKVRDHDVITIDYDDSQTHIVPDIDLPVLYEDDDCIIINKPAGVLTHSVGKLHGEATVASFLRSRLQATSPADAAVVGIRNSKVNQDNLRAGIVHRLDRATSGVIICAKTPQALSWLQKQFHDRQATKTYAAVVTGQMDPEEAIIDMPIERNPKAPATFRVGANGKDAVTGYKVLTANNTYSLLELQPKTGRTHQLRVHLAHQHHPIVGDYMYAGKTADRLYLHAWHLTIMLPNGKQQTFEAPLPPEFTAIMDPQHA